MKNLAEINEKIKKIQEEINTFNNEERKEIKKNNKTIEIYIKELTELKSILYDVLKEKYQELIPKKENIKINHIDGGYEKLMYISNNNFIFKFGLDKNLYEIKYSNSLEKINENLKDIINKFSTIGMTLKEVDFKYSVSLYEYMKVFFNTKETEDFNTKIKETFDSIYWECPEIVNHIYICIINLLEKNKDKFETYIKNKNKENNDYELELNKYYENIKEQEKIIESDNYLIYEKFSNNTLRIEDYLENSPVRKEMISKFKNYDEYISLTKEEKQYFCNQIKNIYYDVCECIWIEKYNYMISKVKNIYSNKSTYTNNYSTLIKTIKSLEKQRNQLNIKLFYIKNKMNGKNRLIKKYNNLFNKVNSKINEIISNYQNYDEVVFINNIITKINDDSTYYDVFKMFESNYSYLINYMKENSGTYEEFIEYLYNPYLNISKSIPFINDINIENKLFEKYDLFDIDINFSDKNKLKEDLEYIIRICTFDINDINIENFKLIFDIEKC